MKHQQCAGQRARRVLRTGERGECRADGGRERERERDLLAMVRKKSRSSPPFFTFSLSSAPPSFFSTSSFCNEHSHAITIFAAAMSAFRIPRAHHLVSTFPPFFSFLFFSTRYRDQAISFSFRWRAAVRDDRRHATRCLEPRDGRGQGEWKNRACP